MINQVFQRAIRIGFFVVVAATIVWAQQARGTLHGTITDELGATIVGANVTLRDANGQEKTTVTGDEGGYTFTGLAPGKFTVAASSKGFASSLESEVEVKAG